MMSSSIPRSVSGLRPKSALTLSAGLAVFQILILRRPSRHRRFSHATHACFIVLGTLRFQSPAGGGVRDAVLADGKGRGIRAPAAVFGVGAARSEAASFGEIPQRGRLAFDRVEALDVLRHAG